MWKIIGKKSNSLGKEVWEHLGRLSCLDLFAVESMILSMENEVQEISNISRNLIQNKGEWDLLNIYQSKTKMTVDNSQYDQIIFYVSWGALVVIFS